MVQSGEGINRNGYARTAWRGASACRGEVGDELLVPGEGAGLGVRGVGAGRELTFSRCLDGSSAGGYVMTGRWVWSAALLLSTRGLSGGSHMLDVGAIAEHGRAVSCVADDDLRASSLREGCK